ncbi:MAG TPA: hypothetical protein VGX45_02330, partial [Solirubrobacteraceae bacterium]|nr:hypothetical protein [Solirubrobacteraceae bacterium]
MAADVARLTAALASVTAAAAIAGCGGSSASSPSPAATSPTTATGSTSTAATSSSTTTSRATTSSSTMPTTTSSQSASVSTAPPSTPAGTPVAPAGLAQTTGYSTYELCSVHCTGAVPASLRRTLHVSGASCGSHSVAGQVTPSVSGTLPVTPFIGSKWDAGRVTWTASPGFNGPMLIRGAEVGGPGAVGFGEGRIPYDELQLYAAAGKPHQWQSFTRVRGPGCYAYQV